MTVSADMITSVRRMVNEPTDETYTDDIIEAAIEKYPLMDELGTDPYYWTTTNTTPVKTFNTNWIPTYNLNYAAADLWEEKAAAISGMFDFSADGGTYNRSQLHGHAMQMAKFYRSRGSVKNIKLIKKPDEPDELSNRPSWIANLPEVRD